MRWRIVFVGAVVFTFLSFLEAGAQDWSLVPEGSGRRPEPRAYSALIYDPAAHQVVLFGGQSDSSALNDVWTFNLAQHRWTERTPGGPAPAPRFTPNAVYDPVRHRMIVWSGQGAAFFNDVWALDLATYTWTELTPPEPRPAVRYGAVSVLHVPSGQLYTFAGFTDRGRFGDTWRFELEPARWTDVTPSGLNPGERCLHTAAFDVSRGRMYVYGGQRNGPLDDLWVFDTKLGTWVEQTPPNRPPGRFFSTSIFHEPTDRVIIFGGNLGSGVQTNELWAFDTRGESWQAITITGGPDARDGSSSVYIPTEDRMIVFGGRADSFYNDLWSLSRLSTPTNSDPDPTIPDDVLSEPFPNPFESSMTILYQPAVPGPVILDVYDVSGRVVRRLVSENLLPGTHSIRWDGRRNDGLKVSAGVYVIRLESSGQVFHRPVVYLPGRN